MPITLPGTRRQAASLALLVTVLWSSSWVLIRWGLDGDGLRPITFAALRYGLAAMLLLLWVIRSERSRKAVALLGRGTFLRIIALGVVMYAIAQGAQFVAIAEQPAATTSLILSLTPVLVAGTAMLALGEAPSRGQVAGSVIIALGAALFFMGELGATVPGMVAATACLAANVAGSVMGRHVNRTAQVAPALVTGLGMAVGAGLLAVVGVGLEGVPQLSARVWLTVAWLAAVNSALAYTLWNASLRELTAVESAGINNTMLIQIALLAWVFLGEGPGVFGMIGVLAVSLGIYLTQAGSRGAVKLPVSFTTRPGS